MARIRSIKPEMPQDAKLASVSRETRYHFVLLFTVADDEGFFRASPRLLLGQLYPHDEDVTDKTVQAMTEALGRIGVLELRQTPDGAVGWLVNWSKHQKIDRPSKSHLREQFARVSRVCSEPLAAGVLSPESLVLSPEVEEEATPSDIVAELLAESNFGPFKASIEGICRSARHPASVIATLRMHLSGEMSHEKGTPLEVGLAAQQFLAAGEDFNPRYFAGFVRGAKKGVERTEARRRNVAEDQHIAAEQQQREREIAEERKANETLKSLEEHEPERFAELQKRAFSAIPPKITFGRDELVRAQLLRLIREHAA